MVEDFFSELPPNDGYFNRQNFFPLRPEETKFTRKRLEEKRLDEKIAKLDKKEEKLKDDITHLEDTIKGTVWRRKR